MKENKTFCVYQHSKPNGEIFYIGIGSEKRSKCKWRRSNFWKNTVNKYGYNIIVLYKNLTEKEAIKLEIKLIKKYGRSDKGLGPLVNHTDGGDGTTGYKHSEESKLKIINALKNRPVSEQTRLKISNSNKGKIRTEKMINNLSQSLTGRNIPKETIYKMRKCRINSKVLLDPNTGVYYDSISDAARIQGMSDETLRKYLITPHLKYKTNLTIV